MEAKKMQVADMILHAVIALQERNGSSRQAIWKHIHEKFDYENYRAFATRFKVLLEQAHLVKYAGGAKYRLSPKARAAVERHGKVEGALISKPKKSSVKKSSKAKGNRKSMKAKDSSEKKPEKKKKAKSSTAKSRKSAAKKG